MAMSVNTITKICQIKFFRKTPAKINNPCYIGQQKEMNMTCKTYRQFSNRVTRLTNAVFSSNGMMQRVNAFIAINGGFDKVAFRKTVETFGSEKQLKAYDDLIQILNDNQEFSKQMHVQQMV